MAKIVKCKNKMWDRAHKLATSRKSTLDDYKRAREIENTELNLLFAESDRVNLEETLVDTFVGFPFGDGRAYYRVACNIPFTLEWIPYGDRWRLTPREERALIDKDVRKEVLWQRMTRVR